MPSFAWKKTADALDLARFNEDFDDLFERGMDPDVDDPMRCHRHSEAPEEWPSPDEVVQYKSRVRSELRTGNVQQDSYPLPSVTSGNLRSVFRGKHDQPK